MAKYYIFHEGKVEGPSTPQELLAFNLNGQSLVVVEGQSQWVAASTVAELIPLLNQGQPCPPAPPCPPSAPTCPPSPQPAAPQAPYQQPANPQPAYQQPAYQQPTYQPNPQPAYPPQPQAPTSDKSRVTFGVLALLLGGLGIQYFYVGKVGAGILTIVLTLVTCGIWEILIFIQAIIVLTMSDADFERKFVYSTTTLPLF